MPNLYKRLGEESLVNTSTDGNQNGANIAVLADGTYVIVWSDGLSLDVRAQRFDSSGARLGSEFTVNTVTTGTQTGANIAMLPSGGYVVTWSDNSGIGGDSSNFGIKAQLFEADGDKVGGEMLVNVSTLNGQTGATVTHLVGGGYVVSWTDNSQQGGDSSEFSVKARVFDTSGVAVSGEILVNTITSGSQTGPSIVALPSGGFAVAFTDFPPSAPGPFHLTNYLQIFDSVGTKVGSPQQINLQTLGLNQTTNIALLPAGMVVTWTDASGTADSSGTGIKAQMFDFNGARVGAEILVNTVTAGDQRSAQVDALPGGGFLVTWTGPGAAGMGNEIHGQVFDAAGAKAGSEFIVNTITSGEQAFQKAAVLPSGDIVLIWTDSSGVGGDSSGSGVKMQIITPDTAGPTDIALSSASVSETAIENLPVATLSATGAINSGFTWQIVSDSTGGAFRIEGDQLVVADNGRLDFETAPTASVRIRATDSDGNAHEETFDLAVTDAAIEQRYAAGDQSAFSGNTTGFDSPASVIQLASGNVLVVNSYFVSGSDMGLRGQIYDSGSNAVGAPFDFGLSEFGSPREVAALPSGGFAVAYRGFHLVNNNPTGLALHVQLFDSAGAKGAGVEIYNGSAATEPSIAVLDSGNILVAWRHDIDESGAGFGSQIMAQMLSPSGGLIGDPFRVNTVTAGGQVWPEAAALPNGGFVVTWRDSELEIKGQYFDSAGVKVGGEFIAVTDAPEVNSYHLAVLDSGELIVSWTELVDNSTDISIHALMAQRVGADGANIGSPIPVSIIATEGGADHGLEAMPGGGFIVTWSSLHPGSVDGGDTESWAQIFDSTGAPVGDPFSLPESPAGHEFRPEVAALESGDLFFAWSNSAVVNNFSTSDASVRMLFLAGDEIMGTPGNDLLDGGPGGDTMTGLAGDDLYIADHGNDQAVELPGGGSDTVHASVGYTLGDNVETLVLTGTAVSGNGNALANSITGNASANILDGRGGADTMAGGLGNDVYYVDDSGDLVIEAASAGTDEIRTGLATFSLMPFANVETLTGTSASGQTLTGNVLANLISGGSGNDVLDGGMGADTMAGGLGNDAYVVDVAGDQVVEAAGGGTDEIRTAFASYSLAGLTNVEKLTGTAATGQALTGNDGANMIAGGAGNDLIDGGLGNDTMIGGFGDDLYIVDQPGDVVTELAGQGVDEIRITNYGTYSLAALPEIENLTATLVGGGLTMTGNALANRITTVSGDDVIDGGAGADVMIGSTGSDTYHVDTIGDSVVELAGEGNDEIRTGLASYSLVPFANVEKLTGTSASGQTLTGNAAANVITGAAGNDVIDGGTGADTMNGGLGNDIFTVDDAGDLVVEAADSGTDEVRTGRAIYTLANNVEKLTGTSDAGQTLTGNFLANIIAAGAGNDVIDGGVGADSMAGGLGNDLYLVDNSGDTIAELSGAGDDEVRTGLATYSIAGFADVERLTGLGIGAQTLTGNASNNIIDGGMGADAMAGGLGNDIFIVDDSGDTISEGAEQGLDEVRTTINFSIAGFANVENLTGGIGDQSLTGNGFNNVIDGGAGADAMAGAGGHDIYIVDNAGDTVTELDGAGTDEVRTSLGSKAAPAYALYVLPNHVENLTGTSAGAQGVRGNASHNVIVMGAGADLIVLDDGGIDSVDGGGGNDFIYYGATLTGDDTTNGGAGTDTLGLLGNYASGINFTAANLIGVERLALYTGSGSFSYAVTMNDANVAAGGEFFVTAASLTGTETLVFNGAAETNGRFTILGGSGGDTIVGGGSSDYVAGNAGNDLLYGLAGVDYLIGGAGADQLRGGAGGDHFRYLSTAESTTGSVDQILDFQHIDRIDLSAIDANGNAGDGNSAFTFIGSNAFGNIAGQLRATQSGSVWTVEGDTNGDGLADLILQVTVTEPAPLGAGDFYL